MLDFGILQTRRPKEPKLESYTHHSRVDSVVTQGLGALSGRVLAGARVSMSYLRAIFAGGCARRHEREVGEL